MRTRIALPDFRFCIFPSIRLTRRANGMAGVEQIYSHCYQEVNVALNVGVFTSLPETLSVVRVVNICAISLPFRIACSYLIVKYIVSCCYDNWYLKILF